MAAPGKLLPNKYHGNTEYQDMDCNAWKNCWKKGAINFHKDFVHPKLMEFYDALQSSRDQLKIFVPLCGKSLDMKWLYDKGHTIIGVEAARQPIEEFFAENNMQYTSSQCEQIDATLWKTVDERIRIYECDLFDFNRNVEGTVDAIWDRGSLVAINRSDRERYGNLLTSLAGSGCRCLLCSYEYDPEKYIGPPHFVPLMQIHNIYRNHFHIELLDNEDFLSDRHREAGLDKFDRMTHLLTLKDF